MVHRPQNRARDAAWRGPDSPQRPGRPPESACDRRINLCKFEGCRGHGGILQLPLILFAFISFHSDTFLARPFKPGPFFVTQSQHDTRAAIARFLFIRDRPAPVDLAFVLGSPTLSSLTPALSLFHAGQTAKILISGRGLTASGLPEWQMYRDHALANGIPPTALLIEPEATNTHENMVFGADLVDRLMGWSAVRSVAICAKAYHLRRAFMTAAKVFPAGVRLIALPADGPGDITPDDWWTTPQGRNRVLEELGRISDYSLKNHLGDI